MPYRDAMAVRVPGGTFVMGTDAPDGYPADGEGPAHEVALSPFSIAPYAVSNAEFAAFVATTGHRTAAEAFGWSFVFSGFLPDDFPATRGVAHERLPGHVPHAQHPRRRVRGDGTRGRVPTQRLRAVPDDRQRVGVDGRLV